MISRYNVNTLIQEMVSVIESKKNDDKTAKCLVRKFPDPLDKTNNDKFECSIDKNKTIRQFVHIVSQFYTLDVDSFYLTFSSFKSVSTSETGSNDKVILSIVFIFKYFNLILIFQPTLIEDDDRLLSEIGVIFDDETQNRFVLSENEIDEIDKAECVIRILKDKIVTLTVDKNETASQLYKRVLELCYNNDISADSFILTLNSYKIDSAYELHKVC